MIGIKLSIKIDHHRKQNEKFVRNFIANNLNYAEAVKSVKIWVLSNNNIQRFTQRMASIFMDPWTILHQKLQSIKKLKQSKLPPAVLF